MVSERKNTLTAIDLVAAHVEVSADSGHQVSGLPHRCSKNQRRQTLTLAFVGGRWSTQRNKMQKDCENYTEVFGSDHTNMGIAYKINKSLFFSFPTLSLRRPRAQNISQLLSLNMYVFFTCLIGL